MSIEIDCWFETIIAFDTVVSFACRCRPVAFVLEKKGYSISMLPHFMESKHEKPNVWRRLRKKYENGRAMEDNTLKFTTLKRKRVWKYVDGPSLVLIEMNLNFEQDMNSMRCSHKNLNLSSQAKLDDKSDEIFRPLMVR